MKKITALFAAAIVALAVSVPVMAEPSGESSAEVSAVSAEESPSVESKAESDISADESKAESDISADESKAESDSSSDEISAESESSAEKPKKVYYTDYAIPEAEMYISFPNDMYVLTRDVDINSPALKACKMTRSELIKNFEQTGNYIRAMAEDFTYEVTVNILKDDNTKKIGDISSLSESDIQTIADNHFEQSMYTGCSRTRYNNIMYLSFPFEYSEEKTKIVGVQKYTIAKGARIVITFQSYTGEMSESFDDLIVSVMDKVLYDGISPENFNEPSPDKKSSAINNLDVRYIYLMLASLLALIFLMLIIVTAMKYKKSSKKVQPEPTVSEPEKIESEQPAEEKTETVIEVTEKETEIPQDKTEETKAVEDVSEEKSEEIEEIEEKPAETVTEIHEEAEEDEELPVIDNQLELVEVAFRIIPALSKEDEDTGEIWNFIDKKYDDLEFFAAHANKNRSNANAFYRINANSNIITPPEQKENIDEGIRKETLESIVGDSEPEKLETEENPVEKENDLNEQADGKPEVKKSDEPESEDEICKPDSKEMNKDE